MNDIEPYLIWYICRHGKTTDNIQEIWTSQLDGKLDKEGEDFAQTLLAQLIKLINPSIIYSSDLERAKSTAHLASEFAKYKKEIIYDKNLREIYFGSLQNKTQNDIQALLTQKGLTQFNNLTYDDLRYMQVDSRAPFVNECNAESINDIETRVNNVIENIKQKSGIIMSVAHGAINAYLVEYALHGTCGYNFYDNDKKFYLQDNTEVTILKFNQNGTLIKPAEVNIPISDVLIR